jgi:hypothetical protein
VSGQQGCPGWALTTVSTHTAARCPRHDRQPVRPPALGVRTTGRHSRPVTLPARMRGAGTHPAGLCTTSVDIARSPGTFAVTAYDPYSGSRTDPPAIEHLLGYRFTRSHRECRRESSRTSSGGASGGVFAGPGRRPPEGVSTSCGCGSLNSTSVSHRERRERGGGKTHGPPMRDAPFRSRARIFVPGYAGRADRDLTCTRRSLTTSAEPAGAAEKSPRCGCRHPRGAPRRATAARPDRRLQPPASARQAR